MSARCRVNDRNARFTCSIPIVRIQTCLKQRQTRIRYLIITILFVVSCFSFADRSALSQAVSCDAEDPEPDAASDGLSALRLRMGLRAGPIALRRPARSLRIEARLRHRHHRAGRSAHSSPPSQAISPPAPPSPSSSFCALFSGLAQSPVFPGNGRIVAAWFPTVGARTRLGDLQLRAIFRAAHLRAHLRMADSTAPAGAAASGSWARWASCSPSVWFTNIYGVKEHPRISPPRLNSSSAAAAW